MNVLNENICDFFCYFNMIIYYFQKPQMRPMIAEYDTKKKGVKNDLSDVVMVK